MPGSIGKTMGALSSASKTAPSFPKKGRKPFVIPSKQAQLDQVSEESLSPEIRKEAKRKPEAKVSDFNPHPPEA